MEQKIKGFENKYKITTEGKVWSEYKKDYLKPNPNHKGYLTISLNIDRRNKTTKAIHRLVAEHFIDNPENKSQVNHIDGDKTNNDISNLEWCSNKENNQHAIDTGLYTPKKCGMCKEIKVFNNETNKEETYFSIANFAETYNYPVASVRSCFVKRGKYKKFELK